MALLLTLCSIVQVAYIYKHCPYNSYLHLFLKHNSKMPPHRRNITHCVQKMPCCKQWSDYEYIRHLFPLHTIINVRTSMFKLLRKHGKMSCRSLEFGKTQSILNNTNFIPVFQTSINKCNFSSSVNRLHKLSECYTNNKCLSLVSSKSQF